ncbi:aldo/keto reductase [Mucilaginibacter sp. Bleaf8]|uniref:aldo/keto reductase n=1 Tax=Mucilaginibacter sp. Bleaf8 TaxID=2834430 RepID=UPI001BCCA0F6|nr:aldo/keto reductase [Mucilaginibacter sp. Bleaf8]MBS7563475.1 aldo/keto reductase [Mucilaginibacter sp. Bleaf8]
MLYINQNNTSIPALGFGTYQLKGDACVQSTETALRLGYRHLDTAEFYHNEAEVGKAMRNSGLDRKEIFLTTKVWPTNITKSKFLPAVEESLRQLKLDYVDLLLIHWPADDELTNRTAVDILAECLHKQYARLIGVSNFSIPQLQQAQSQAPIVCNQVEYHPYYSQQEMLDYLNSNNMFLTAYSPLGQGNMLDDATLKDVAAHYGKSVSQVVLRWLLQQPGVSVIPKASSEKHQSENLNIFDFELDAEHMERISALSQNNKKYC